LQVVLTGFTPFYLLEGDLIWCARELQARSGVSWLPARLPLALFTQAFRLARETIRGRRQMAVMAVFAHALFQRVKALLQLSNQFVSLLQLLFQQDIFLFQLRESFFWSHAATLHPLGQVGKSLGDLSSYIDS
jgi:hypothetical protein